jgi:hypothetical protein
MGADHKPYERSLRDRTDAATSSALGAAATAEALIEGRSLPLADAIDVALEVRPGT